MSLPGAGAAAFEEALRRWPGTGVPENPEGWLLTVSRNRQRDVRKSSAVRASVPLEEDSARVDPLADHDPFVIGDKRLELFFVCAHPAIDAAARTPLMLQLVLGFEAADIARAFAVAPATMAQRLVRAKRRIKDARIPFVVPDRRAMPERLPVVIEAVYGCAALTWRGGAESLAGEAQYLAVTLAGLLSTEAEAWGLASLTTLTLARRRKGRSCRSRNRTRTIGTPGSSRRVRRTCAAQRGMDRQAVSSWKRRPRPYTSTGCAPAPPTGQQCTPCTRLCS